MDDAHDVEELALVLVDALNLDVEHGVGGHLDAGGLLDHLGAESLALLLGGAPLGLELLVLGEGGELLEERGVGDPLVGADGLGDDVGELRVAEREPAAGSDAVGLVLELLGVELGEVLEGEGADNLGCLLYTSPSPRD